MSSRLTLENFIFYRAAYLHAEIVAVNGCLFCYRADPYLQISVYLYNQFFARSEDVCTGRLYGDEIGWGGVKNGWILPPSDVKIKNKFDKNYKL